MPAVSHTNRCGVTYYVHAARTKTGRVCYVAKRTAEGALPRLPEGLEIVENVNGQVSVRTVRRPLILPLEEQLVRQSLERHDRRQYRAEAKDRFITIHEPQYDPEGMVARLADPLGDWGELGRTVGAIVRRQVGDTAWEEYLCQRRERAERQVERGMRYSPVLRFQLDDADRRLYSVDRMRYTGYGGWLALSFGLALPAACDRYIPLLGTEKLFEVL